MLIQAGSHIALPVSLSEQRQGITRPLDVQPQHIIASETEPGDGCEAANIVNRFRWSGHSIRPPPVFLNEPAGLFDLGAALARQNSKAV